MSKNVVFFALVGVIAYCLPPDSKTSVPAQSDVAFLAMAAQADMTIVHISKMAQDRAVSGKLKDFANTLVQEHSSDYQQVAELAANAGEAVPKGIDRQNDRIIAALDRSKGKPFDHAFLVRQLTEHEKLAGAFEREAKHGSNPAIKAYATKALPTIERHLHHAQDLLKQRG
jgi:putative membrane protein